MSNFTENYQLKKPIQGEFYDVAEQNGNMDIIDRELKKREQGQTDADKAIAALENPVFEDYTGGTTVPDAATAINNIKSKGKLSTILSNVKAAFKGACLIGQIVNNCVTNRPDLPGSAAQLKVLMDLYTSLNNNLGNIKWHIFDNTTSIQSQVAALEPGIYFGHFGAYGHPEIGAPVSLNFYAKVEKTNDQYAKVTLSTVNYNDTYISTCEVGVWNKWEKVALTANLDSKIGTIGATSDAIEYMKYAWVNDHYSLVVRFKDGKERYLYFDA